MTITRQMKQRVLHAMCASGWDAKSKNGIYGEELWVAGGGETIKTFSFLKYVVLCEHGETNAMSAMARVYSVDELMERLERERMMRARI
jgi:hypothetical protein